MVQLNEKHLKALELLRDNKYTIVEVAKLSGINKGHLYDLVNGNTKKAGTVAQIFQSEYQKSNQTIDNRSTLKGSQLREKTINRLLSWVSSIKNASDLGKESRRTLIDIINALKTVSPLSIEANIYKTGLSEEDLLNEFRRLKSLARAAIERGRVQKPLDRGKGEMPLLSPEGAGEVEDSQDIDIPTIPETKEVPPEQEDD